MAEAPLQLIALALFAELNARIDNGEPRALVFAEKGLTEVEYQLEQQRWLGLLAAQAQQQQWQTQQRYSALYAQWRLKGNGAAHAAPPRLPPDNTRGDGASGPRGPAPAPLRPATTSTFTPSFTIDPSPAYPATAPREPRRWAPAPGATETFGPQTPRVVRPTNPTETFGPQTPRIVRPANPVVTSLGATAEVRVTGTTPAFVGGATMATPAFVPNANPQPFVPPSPAAIAGSNAASTEAPRTANVMGQAPANVSGYFSAAKDPVGVSPNPSASAASGLPLSFEQLTCLTAEVEVDPGNSERALGGYGLTRAAYQSQLNALQARCEADAELAERHRRLLQYYRSIVAQR